MISQNERILDTFKGTGKTFTAKSLGKSFCHLDLLPDATLVKVLRPFFFSAT